MYVYLTKIIDPSAMSVFVAEVSETMEIALLRCNARAGYEMQWETTEDKNIVFTTATDDVTGAEYTITHQWVVSENGD